MSKSHAWPVTLSAIFAGIVIAIIQNKVIPCLAVLQDAFSATSSTAGWLSSIFCVMSIVMAFPAATITNRLGIKKTCFFSMVCAILGSLLGIFSNSIAMLMFSRIVEGIGAGLISIAVPSIIPLWFPPEKRGLPTGIWSSWQFVAQALCFFFGVSITNAFGWHGIWWGGLILAVIAAVLCLLVVRSPRSGEGYSADEENATSLSIRQGLRSRSVWMASLAMFCFCFACFGFVTWAAECWATTLGITIDLANRYVSIFAIISLPVVILVGMLMDRLDHRRFGICACFGYIFAVAASFLLPDAKFVLPFVIIYPFFEGAVSTCLWTIIPQTVREAENVPVAVALFTLTSNVGMLIGPPAVGMIVESFGWKAGAIPVALIMLLGTILMLFVKEYIPSGQKQPV